ncbi:MAG: outer membrane lipoprotein-sorting protein [Bdellovibrionales bacterium]|nr:outer membrane lipoprotein-sorting protein [Bdellovibrionales bacterium]
MNFLVILLFLVSSQAHADRGLEIMKKAEEFNNGFVGESSTMEMVLVNAHGDKVERKMNSKVQEVSDDGDKSIITFLWPADVKGTKMLTWSHKTENDDQWLYLPALKRVKRITSTNKTGSFMGSEFSYEDLGSQEVEKYTYTFKGEKDIKGRKAWVIERKSTDKNSGYGKQVVHLDKEYQNPLQIGYFDRKMELLKVAEFSNYKKYGKYWRASKIEMKNVQTKKKSILEWKNRKLNQKFSDADFNQNRLKM